MRDILIRFTQWLHQEMGLDPEAQHKILASAVALIVVLAARWILLRVVHRRLRDWRRHYRWRKSSGYAAFMVFVVAAGAIWLEGLRSLSTFLGLFSAGVAIALKDLFVNLAGWAFIMWRRPFEVGDRIQIGHSAGDVIDVRIFQFSLLEIGNWVDADQSTGRVIHVPNGKVFTDTQANYDKGFQYIWNELPVLVTFESNWRRAKEILQRVADRHEEHLSEAARAQIRAASRRFLIFYSHLTPTVYTSVRDSGVLLTIRYLTEPRRRRGSAQAIWEDVLAEFGACDDIDFAYPTRRFYDNRLEGKGATAGPPPGEDR